MNQLFKCEPVSGYLFCIYPQTARPALNLPAVLFELVLCCFKLLARSRRLVVALAFFQIQHCFVSEEFQARRQLLASHTLHVCLFVWLLPASPDVEH